MFVCVCDKYDVYTDVHITVNAIVWTGCTFRYNLSVCACPYAAFQVGGCGNVIKGTIFQIIYMLAGFICRFIDTHALQLSVYGLIYYSHI